VGAGQRDHAEKKIKTGAGFLLDTTVVSHLIPILRGVDPAKKKIKLFNRRRCRISTGRSKTARRDSAGGLTCACGNTRSTQRSPYGAPDEKRLSGLSASTNSLAELEGWRT
jgi:hypothetical protein